MVQIFTSFTVTSQGLGLEWACLELAGVVCGSLTLRREDFTTQLQVILRVCLLKLGTVKQRRG